VKGVQLLLILLLTLAATSLHAQQNRFDAANDLLEDQQFMEAIDAYRSIADDGYVSGALWLNIGVSYAQLDSLGKAKYYLMRSAQFPETKQIARESLEVVNNRFSRRSAVLPPLPWEQFFEWVNRSLGIIGLVVGGLILLNFGAGFILASWFYPGQKKTFKYLSLTAGVLAVLFLAGSLYVNHQNNRYDTGVTVERQSTVYAEPNPDSAAVSTAYEGYTMRVDQRESQSADGWYYIRLENGRFGWIDENAIMTF